MESTAVFGAAQQRGHRESRTQNGQPRPVSAWLIACIAAGATMGIVGSAMEPPQQYAYWLGSIVLYPFYALAYGLFYGVFIMLFTGPVVPVVLTIARRLNMPRGWIDAVLGGLVGLIEGWWFIDFSIEPWRLMTLAMFAPAGVVGGLTYWLLAGRPRPPYRHPLLPGRVQDVVST